MWDLSSRMPYSRAPDGHCHSCRGHACCNSEGGLSRPAALESLLANRLPLLLRRALHSETLKDMPVGKLKSSELVSTASEGAASWDGDGMDLSSDVPDEVLRHILSLLSPLCLARAGASCRKWRQLAAEDELWRPHLARLPRGVRGTAAAAAVAGMPGARQQLSRILTGAIGVLSGRVSLLCQHTGV